MSHHHSVLVPVQPSSTIDGAVPVHIALPVLSVTAYASPLTPDPSKWIKAPSIGVLVLVVSVKIAVNETVLPQGKLSWSRQL